MLGFAVFCFSALALSAFWNIAAAFLFGGSSIFDDV